MIKVQRSDIWLKANEKKVIPIYLFLPFGSNRIEKVIDKINELTEGEVELILSNIINESI